MTTSDTAGRVKTPKTGSHFRFPDPPEREPDDMTSFNQLTPNGNVHHLIQHPRATRTLPSSPASITSPWPPPAT